MGYNINIIDSDETAWFSIWNWHRCLAFAGYGLGLLNSQELESELMRVNQLQNFDEGNKKPGDEELLASSEVVIEECKKSETKILRLGLHSDDPNDELRITGGTAVLPVTEEMKLNEENLDRQTRLIRVMIEMCRMTNGLCLDYLSEMTESRKEAAHIGAMDGDPISAITSNLLAKGSIVGLAKIAQNKQWDNEVGELVEIDTPHDIPEYLTNLTLELPSLDFELDEYWSGKDFLSLRDFTHILLQVEEDSPGILIT